MTTHQRNRHKALRQQNRWTCLVLPSITFHDEQFFKERRKMIDEIQALFKIPPHLLEQSTHKTDPVIEMFMTISPAAYSSPTHNHNQSTSADL